jgi:DegV family protein with EDD domain
MNKVVILTDSTAYIPQEYLDSLPIEVIPLSVIWDGKTYRDGIDLTPKEFYTRLAKSSSLPTTSQVSVNAYQEMFRKLLDKGYQILTLPISSGISGSVYSAFQAKESFKKDPVEVIDTKLVSMALTFQVLTAARAAKAGASLEECKNLAIKAYDTIGVYFTVETLKYLHMGGRIGGAQRLFGTALRIKPILSIRDGKIDAVKSAITSAKAVEAMVQLVARDVAGKSPVRISVFHANVPEMAQTLLDRCVKQFNAVEGILSWVSPVVGSHVGPGTISIAYQAGL